MQRFKDSLWNTQKGRRPKLSELPEKQPSNLISFSLSLPVILSLSLSICLSLSSCNSLSLTIYMSLSLSLFICLSLSLFLSLTIYFSLSTSLSLYLSLSIYIYMFFLRPPSCNVYCSINPIRIKHYVCRGLRAIFFSTENIKYNK